MIIVQGWSSVIPKFSGVDFVSYYIEIPVMIIMFFAWLVVTGARPKLSEDTRQDLQHRRVCQKNNGFDRNDAGQSSIIPSDAYPLPLPSLLMNDYRDNDPNFDPNLANASSRRGSTSTQSTSAERRFQDGSSRSSGSRQPSYDDAKSLKRQLLVANEKLKGHDLLAADYEQQLLTLAAQFKRANDARIIAVREAAIAKEELGLYKIQLEHANQEIQRAQKLLDKVEDERYEAEKAAAESRALARRYHRDLLMIKAMEEGRKIGMREGIEQGRALALRETGEHSDVNEADYADDYFDYTDNGADYPRRSRSLLLPSNEEIVVHPPRSPTPPDAPPPPPPQPIPVPPPDLVQPVPSTRPLSFRSASPSVYHQQVSIPPDGYIPVVDADNIIRMPPPHELARPPPTPERPSSPQLSQIAPEEPRPTPRSRARRQSTASFTSTSTFSNMAGPSGRNAPLCAIEEVQTPHASPLPQPVDDRPLRHQPSRHPSLAQPRATKGEKPPAGNYKASFRQF
ncbi:hypothetical protein H0H87_004176 [Tephrocybe sp. NHM501043]|nr:hypothetical protein H0H87_004176 [Tephrocybe sp. NHM501043]